MKNTRHSSAPQDASFENFDRLLRAVVAVPKAAVEKEEARERLKNRVQRAKRKAAKKKG